MRVRIAASAPPSVNAGKIKCTHVDGELHAAVPETGKSPSEIAKNKIKMGPSAKFGNDRPSRLTKLRTRSSQRLRRRAERTPAGIANTSAPPSEAKVKSNVDGYASLISAATGCCSRNDLPRSPWSTPRQ